MLKLTTKWGKQVIGLIRYDWEVVKVDKEMIQSMNKALYHVFESITHK